MFIKTVLASVLALAAISMVNAEGIHYCQPRLPDKACIKTRISDKYYCVAAKDNSEANLVDVYDCEGEEDLNRWNFSQAPGSEDYDYEYYITNADNGDCAYPQSNDEGALIAEKNCDDLSADQKTWKITWRKGKKFGWVFKHVDSGRWLNVGGEDNGERHSVLGEKKYWRIRDHKGNWPGTSFN